MSLGAVGSALAAAAARALGALKPVVAQAAEAAIVETVNNIGNHPDPLGAAELAAMVTSSRVSSVAIINAVLRLRRKARK